MTEDKNKFKIFGFIDLLIFFIVAANLYPNNTFFTLTMSMWLVIMIWVLIISLIILGVFVLLLLIYVALVKLLS